MTDYGIGAERDGSFPDWREYPFLIDGEERGKIEKTDKGYRADVTYTGVPRDTLALAYTDGQRQAEAKRGRFTGKGLTVEVKALAATDTQPSRFAVLNGGARTELSRPGEYEGITAAEWAVRQVLPTDEPVYVKSTGTGWLFRI